MASRPEDWLHRTQAERRSLAEQAGRAGDVEALWSLTEMYLSELSRDGLEPDPVFSESRRAPADGPVQTWASSVRAGPAARRRPLAPNTLRTYRQSVGMLVERWRGDALLRPTGAMVAELLGELEKSGASLSTIKVRLAGARALYRALVWVGAVEQDPFQRIGPVHGSDQPRRRQPYSREEQERLLRQATPVDRALILLSSGVGLSVSECVGLRWSDLDLRNGRLIRRRRDGSEEEVMLSDSVVETLYRLAPRNGDRVLGFTSDVRARQRMKRLCEQAGVPYRGVQALRLASRGGSGAADKAFPVDREPAGQPLEVVTDYRRLQEELIRVSAEAGRTGSSFGLLTISINHLPPVEDEGSRRLNREVLQACAARIARLRRRYDVVAHCSSRTFCVVLKNLESGADLSSIAQRFSQALHSDPVTVDGRPYRVSAHMDTGIGPDAATALIGRDSRSPALDAVGPALGKK